MSLTLHHIGYLTRQLAADADRFCATLGYQRVGPPIRDETQTVTVQFLWLDPMLLELVEPLHERSKVSRALASGVTFHHLCYATDALDADADRLRGTGMVELYRGPAAAFPGQRIAWLYGPDLVELVGP